MYIMCPLLHSGCLLTGSYLLSITSSEYDGAGGGGGNDGSGSGGGNGGDSGSGNHRCKKRWPQELKTLKKRVFYGKIKKR